jgi:hypothetical protein
MQDTAREAVLQMVPGGNKAVQRRVFSWLHADQVQPVTRRHAGAEFSSSTSVATKPAVVSDLPHTPPFDSHDVPVHQRAAKMWKRCEW